MPENKPVDQKDVKVLTPEEMGQESVRIKSRLDAIMAALRKSGNIPAGKTNEELIGYLTSEGHQAATDDRLWDIIKLSPNHPEARSAETQLKEGDKYAIKKLGELADEYKALQKRDTEIGERLKANPSAQTDAQKAAAAATGPQLESQDPLAQYTAQFLDDRDIEDLARTGQFDITPTAIAAMFPSAGLQQAQAQAQTEGLPPPDTFIDKLAPEQYQDTSFVHTGDMPGAPSSQDLAIQRIKEQGLPAWEEGRMIDLVLKSQQRSVMTEADYDARAEAIRKEGMPPPLEARRLAELRQIFNASQSKAGTDLSKGNSSLREVVQRPYSWTADQIAATAVELFKGGYINISDYDPTKALSQQMHITSAFDPQFQKAYQAWVSDSFKDRKKNMMEILKDRQNSFLPQLKQIADQIEASKPKLVIQLADAQGVRQTAQTLAQQVAGHNLGDDEYSQLISYIHGLQANSQTAAFNAVNAPGATGGTVEDVDVNARLEAAIRANHPVDAGAKDIADQADFMRAMFAGPVR